MAKELTIGFNDTFVSFVFKTDLLDNYEVDEEFKKNGYSVQNND